MTTITPAAALKIANRLLSLEGEIDAALRSSARLPSEMLEELARAGAAPIAAQRVLDAATETLTALVAARGKVARTHGQLLSYAREAGLMEGYGDQIPCQDYITGLTENASADIVRLAA